MTQNRRNQLILLAVVLILILLGVVGSVDYNQRLRVSHDAFTAELAATQQYYNAQMTAVSIH